MFMLRNTHRAFDDGRLRLLDGHRLVPDHRGWWGKLALDNIVALIGIRIIAAIVRGRKNLPVAAKLARPHVAIAGCPSILASRGRRWRTTQ